MYMALDMTFQSPQQATEKIGDIKMYYVGLSTTGYIKADEKRFRQYILLSKDISKLNNITNALDGSNAFVVDIDETYTLCNNQWVIKN